MDDLRLPYSEDLVFLRADTRDWIVRIAEALAEAEVPHHVVGDPQLMPGLVQTEDYREFNWEVFVREQDLPKALAVEAEVVRHSGAPAPSFDEPDVTPSPEEQVRLRRAGRLRTSAAGVLALAVIVSIANLSGFPLAAWWVVALIAVVGVALWRHANRMDDDLLMR